MGEIMSGIRECPQEPANAEGVKVPELSTQHAIAFLTVCAEYFERRPTGGEDAAHWSNVSNGAMCRKIATMLSPAGRVEEEARKFFGPMKASLMNMRRENLLDERDRCLGYIEEVEYRMRRIDQAATASGSGRNLADATPKHPPSRREEG